MMKKTLSVVTLLAAGLSHAAGFSFDTHSARANGLSFTTTAIIDDASAVAYNPANILGVEKLQILLGDDTTIPDIRFTPAGGEEQKMASTIIPPPHVFAVYRFDEKLAAGIGLYVPFAAGANWKDDFVARTRGHKARLATYYITPTIAYQAHERLRFGAGVSLIRGTVAITRQLNFIEREGTIDIGGGGWGFGYNAGMNLVLIDKLLSFGAQFRAPAKISFKGKADFQEIPAAFEGLLKDQPLTADFNLPGTVNLGIAVTPVERLTLAFDAQLALWGTFETFFIEFDDPALNNPLPKNWNNTWNFRMGAEYALTDSLTARAGLAYDPSPSPDETLTPDLPDSNRYKASLGFGYKFDPFWVDGGYQYVHLGDKESTAPGYPGIYNGAGHVFGISVGYSLK